MEDIDILATMIKNSARPLILAGGGVIRSNASKELADLACLINAPVALTMMGLGALSAEDPLYTGMIGMHGTKASNIASDECDLLIAIGTRFSDRVTIDANKFAANAKIVHVDIDRAEINKNVNVDHHITGDAKTVITELLSLLASQTVTFDHSHWINRIASLIENSRNDHCPGSSNFISSSNVNNSCANPDYIAVSKPYPSPDEVIQVIRELAGEETTIVTDVGQHQLWVAQHYKFTKPNTFLSSGGYGAMGFGAGAAIGACLGLRDKYGVKKHIILITGDGSFRMNSMELATIEHYRLPVITVILNNHTLGMVRQWQQLFYGSRYSATDLDRGPDFVKLAEAYSIDGLRANSISEFTSALRKMLSTNKPGLIDLEISKESLVTPMVSPGAGITDFVTE